LNTAAAIFFLEQSCSNIVYPQLFLWHSIEIKNTMAQRLGADLGVALTIKERLHSPVAARATLAAISDVLNTMNSASADPIVKL